MYFAEENSVGQVRAGILAGRETGSHDDRRRWNRVDPEAALSFKSKWLAKCETCYCIACRPSLCSLDRLAAPRREMLLVPPVRELFEEPFPESHLHKIQDESQNEPVGP